MRTKKMVEEEIVTCDFCKEGDVYTDDNCAVCKKDMCHDCSRNPSIGMILHASVWCDSSRDIVVCNDCKKKLPSISQKDNPLLYAYMDVERLRVEYNSFVGSFKPRMNQAEQRVKDLR